MMKILFCHRPGGAYGFITDGMINAFRDKGHQVQRWDGHQPSWHAFDPDIYIGASGHRQNIPKQRKAKIALHVNPYGPISLKGLSESEESINWVLQQKPDCVYGYGWHTDKLLWEFWETKHGIPWVPTPTAGDKTIFKLHNTSRTHDIVYVGGYWPYKGTNISAFLFPLLDGKLQYKIHGWGQWPNNYCSGSISDDDVPALFNSGKVAPCISEPHTYQYGIDIPERAFKVGLCGALIVHDSTTAIKNLIPSAIVTQNPKELYEICHQHIKNQSYQTIAEQQRQEILNSHTYHHRMSAILSQLGYEKEAEAMLK